MISPRRGHSPNHLRPMTAASPELEAGVAELPAPRAGAPVKDRLFGLEWLRAAGAILVVVLHAGIPYQTRDFPGLTWCIHPTQRSAAVNLVGWWIDGFIMPLFILLSGYFAAKLLKQKGAAGFLKHRFARLGGPLLFGFIFILPYDLYAWLLGWVVEERLPIGKLFTLKIEAPLSDGLWGVSHLWFLEYMLSYCLVAWAVQQLALRWPDAALSARKLLSRLPHGASLLALLTGTAVCGAVLWIQPRILLGFRHAWFPQWENWLFFAIPFALGWFWETPVTASRDHRLNGAIRILAATALFAALWPALDQQLAAETIPTRDLWLPMAFSGFGLLMATGLFGLARSLKLASIPFSVGNVAKASFWIYLAHHPLVGLCQVHLLAWDFSPVTKALLTSLVVTGLCLASYEVLVRRTKLGLLLNGVQEGRQAAAPQPSGLPVERQAA